VLWALAQPAAVAGLVVAFVLGTLLRTAGQVMAARAVALPVSGAFRIDSFGLVAAVFGGTGWGVPVPAGARSRLVVLAGPLLVVGSSQVAFAIYHSAYPDLGLPLRLYRPSEVLHGAVAPPLPAEFGLSVAVGLLCFGLLALLPVPPLDGYRLLPWLARGASVPERIGMVVVLVLLTVPVAGRPPLQMALDLVAGPLVRVWS
jgi:hypothetical protein